MSIVNAALRAIFDLLLSPFRELPAIWGILVASIVVSALMLLIFKYTSNQKALAAAKDGVTAGLFEIRMFNDNLPAIMRAQGSILRSNLTYLRHSLPPMLWIIPPLFFIVAQMQFHYGHRGFAPGEVELLKVELAEGAVDAEAGKPKAELMVPAGLTVETPAVWSAVESELAWRVRADEPGDYEIQVELEGETYTKTARVTDSIVRVSPVKVRGFWKELIYPAEAPLPKDGIVESISFAQPERDVGFLFWKTHWLVVFFVLALVFMFLLRKPLGVTI